jgi:exonuclease SbcC
VASRSQHDEAVATLDAAARAAAVQGDLKALRRAEVELDSARDAATAARARVAPLGLDDRSVDGTRLVLERIETASALVEEVAVRAAALTERTRRRDEVSRLDEQLRAATEDLDRRAEDAAAAVARAEQDLGDARSAAAQAEPARRVVEDLERLHRLRVDHDEGLRASVGAASALAQARQAAQDLRQVYQDRRQAQLDGMAAELAAGLEDGAPCPVCGAHDHPEPARSSEPVTAEAVESAEVGWRRSESAAATLASDLAALEAATRERLSQLGGEQRTVDELAEALRGARAERQALVERAGHEAALQLTCEQERVSAQSVATRLAETRLELTAAAAAADTLERDLAAERIGLAEALVRHRDCPCAAMLDPSSPEDHTAVRQTHGRALAAVQHFAGCLERAAAARSAHDALAEEVGALLAEIGFEGAIQARSAMLSPEEARALRGTVTAWEQALAQAQATLDDPDVQTAVMGPEPDLPGLTQASEQARSALLRASSADTLLRRTIDGLARVRAGIESRCARLATALAEDDVIRELADALGGAGSNTLRMRLSSFVLAARLEKVAALANERLASMGDGRYQLRHTDGLAARGARSGLGLEVLDLWTGQARETSSLSGGESFMASLALALGLADAVREEAGGFELQTLFVDEGFGTLDDESLEQVMEVLDGLREGGRAVGVVSHVAELRSRIPSQVVVSKTERGSTVRLAGAESATPAA